MNHSATVIEMTDNRLDFNAAQSRAGQALASLHLGRRFSYFTVNSDGELVISGQDWATPSMITACIALASPCVDLKVALIEDEEIETVVAMMVTWRADVIDGEGYAHQLIRGLGWLAEAAVWALAFVEANCVLIDEAAALLVRNGGQVTFEDFALLFDGRTADADGDMIEAAEIEFIGSRHALDLVDEAVTERSEWLARDTSN